MNRRRLYNAATTLADHRFFAVPWGNSRAGNRVNAKHTATSGCVGSRTLPFKIGVVGGDEQDLLHIPVCTTALLSILWRRVFPQLVKCTVHCADAGVRSIDDVTHRGKPPMIRYPLI